jgi:hypothetical protein
MFQTTTATAVPPRPAYPDRSRIVVDADRRTRELADEMLRLKAEHPDGCTDATLLLSGYSLYEQRKLGPAARQIANTAFVRQVAESAPPPPTDDEIIAEALALGAPLLRRLVIKLRAHHSDDALGRTWRKIATGLASQIARAPLPERLGNQTEEVA